MLAEILGIAVPRRDIVDPDASLPQLAISFTITYSDIHNLIKVGHLAPTEFVTIYFLFNLP